MFRSARLATRNSPSAAALNPCTHFCSAPKRGCAAGSSTYISLSGAEISCGSDQTTICPYYFVSPRVWVSQVWHQGKRKTATYFFKASNRWIAAGSSVSSSLSGAEISCSSDQRAAVMMSAAGMGSRCGRIGSRATKS